MPQTHNLLAIDVGKQRIGLAVASSIARLSRPLATLENNDKFWQQLSEVVEKEQIGEIIIGLPRSLEGRETEQTAYTRNFAEDLKQRFSLPVYFQDEALTSHHAETELKHAGKWTPGAHVDALAAALILEDFLSHPSEAKRYG